MEAGGRMIDCPLSPEDCGAMFSLSTFILFPDSAATCSSSLFQLGLQALYRTRDTSGGETVTEMTMKQAQSLFPLITGVSVIELGCWVRRQCAAAGRERGDWKPAGTGIPEKRTRPSDLMNGAGREIFSHPLPRPPPPHE